MSPQPNRRAPPRLIAGALTPFADASRGTVLLAAAADASRDTLRAARSSRSVLAAVDQRDLRRKLVRKSASSTACCHPPITTNLFAAVRKTRRRSRAAETPKALIASSDGRPSHLAWRRWQGSRIGGVGRAAVGLGTKGLGVKVDLMTWSEITSSPRRGHGPPSVCIRSALRPRCRGLVPGDGPVWRRIWAAMW
jgi:hypothetical protein